MVMDEEPIESGRVAPRAPGRAGYENRQIGLLIAGGALAVVVVFALGILVGRYLMGSPAPKREVKAGPPAVAQAPKEEKPAVQPSPLSQLPPAPPVALPAAPSAPPGEAKESPRQGGGAPPASTKPLEEPRQGGAAPAEPKPSDGKEAKAPPTAQKKEPDRFTFYRTLTTKKENERRVDLEPSKKEKAASAKKPSKAEPAAAAKKEEKEKPASGGKSASGPKDSELLRSGKPKPKEEKVAKAPEKAEESAGPAKPASARKYVVQVGAYRQEADAEKVAGELRDKGYQVQVTSVDLADKGKWYRVRVGSPASKEEAEVRAKEFEEKEKNKAAVLPE